MITKRLLFLNALILCCCIITLHASPRQGCKCLRPTSGPIFRRMIERIEVFPISGSCRKTEVIIYRKSGSRACVNPDDERFKKLLKNLQGQNESVSTTSVSPTASTIDF